MLSSLAAIAMELRKLTPSLLPVVVELVRSIAGSKDPKLAAERALKAAAGEQLAEQLLRAAYRRG